MKRESLHPSSIALPAEIIGRKIVRLKSTASTNDDAWELFLQGAPEGTTAITDFQRAGRGRFGRRWLCAPGTGILMSTILCPEIEIRRSSVLTIMGAVAVAETLNALLAVPAVIRWPNDVMAKGKKLGGILVESRRDPKRGVAFVIGIGLNVNATADQIPPEIAAISTSLRILTGSEIERDGLAAALLRSLDKWYSCVRHGRYDAIAQQWRQYSSSLGERVTVEQNGRRYTGRILDISIEEGLILKLDGGGTMVFDSGSVSVIYGDSEDTRPVS